MLVLCQRVLLGSGEPIAYSVIKQIVRSTMVTGVGTTMPTGGVTVGATPPAQHVPQEAGQPPAQTTPAVTATRRSSENRRVSF